LTAEKNVAIQNLTAKTKKEIEELKKSKTEAIRNLEAEKNKKIRELEQEKQKLEDKERVAREKISKLEKEKQVHHSHLQELFKTLRSTTTNVAPSNLPSDNNTLANLVQEQVAASQAEKENRGREIEQLK